MSQMEMDQLKSNLMGDAATAQSRTQEAFSTRGAPEDSSFSPKALRIGNKAFGQAEMAQANNSIDLLIGHYKQTAAFKDEAQAGQFELEMRKKFNQYKLELMRHAGETEKELTRRGIEKAQRAKIMEGINATVGAATFAIATGLGGRGPSSPATSSVVPGYGNMVKE